MTATEDRRTIAALRESERVLQKQIDSQAKEIDRLRDLVKELTSSKATTGTFSREVLDEIDDCTCIEFCDEDPKTACSLSGRPHVHPEIPGSPGVYGPCPVHPGRPGDH